MGRYEAIMFFSRLCFYFPLLFCFLLFLVSPPSLLLCSEQCRKTKNCYVSRGKTPVPNSFPPFFLAFFLKFANSPVFSLVSSFFLTFFLCSFFLLLSLFPSFLSFLPPFPSPSPPRTPEISVWLSTEQPVLKAAAGRPHKTTAQTYGEWAGPVGAESPESQNLYQ